MLHALGHSIVSPPWTMCTCLWHSLILSLHRALASVPFARGRGLCSPRASLLALGMASSASPSWMEATSRRFERRRNKDIEGVGLQRWRAAANMMKEYSDVTHDLERSQIMLNDLRKDFATKKLQFDPHRYTFMVEGRPVQVHVPYRLLQGSGGTLLGSRSLSPALVREPLAANAFLGSRSPSPALVREIFGTFLGT